MIDENWIIVWIIYVQREHHDINLKYLKLLW
jgi:hypothetical protein